MNEAVYFLEKYRGMKIEAMQDQSPEDPRWCNNFGNMICFHKRYELGDVHSMTIEELQEEVNRQDTIALPIFMLDHSGVTIGTSPFGCPWDSGQLGYIYVTHDEIKRELRVEEVTPQIEAQVVRMLESIIREYDYFVRGEIWLVWAEDENGEHFQPHLTNVGPVGDDALAEARAIIDDELRMREERRQARLKTLVKNRVPLWKRQELMASA